MKLPKRSIKRVLSSMPDCDDVLRRLADVLNMAQTCRRRACREAGQCRGGFGPPCYFARRAVFAEAVEAHMDEYRTFWARERKRIVALFMREDDAEAEETEGHVWPTRM